MTLLEQVIEAAKEARVPTYPEGRGRLPWLDADLFITSLSKYLPKETEYVCTKPGCPCDYPKSLKSTTDDVVTPENPGEGLVAEMKKRGINIEIAGCSEPPLEDKKTLEYTDRERLRHLEENFPGSLPTKPCDHASLRSSKPV